MWFVSLDQKIDLVSKSHWFLYGFFILNEDITENVCCHTFALDSSSSMLIKKKKIHFHLF